MNYKTLTDQEEYLGKQIVDSAYKVHKELGPGLLESVYEICFCHELAKRNIEFDKQVKVPVEYDGIVIDESFRMDVFVDNSIICELKAVEKHNLVWEAQLLTYLKLTNKRLGYIINFNVPLIKNGIKRIIL